MVFLSSVLKQRKILIFAFLLFSQAGFASDQISETTKEKAGVGPFHNSPWKIFGGVGGGLGSVSGQEYQESPQGAQLLISGLISYQLPRWVFDGGASWMYSKVSGTNAANIPINVQTRSGMLNLSPRYRLSEKWQLGPTYDLAFGTDTGFGPAISQSIGTSFVGLKAVYEMPYEIFPVRFWMQAATDVSISDRQVYLALVGVQIGIPLGRSRNESVQEKVQWSSAPPARAPETQKVQVDLDPQKVFFSTNSGVLKPEVVKILTDIGSYLKANPEEWKSVEVSGHADQRGSYQYNLKLSKRRATSVSKALLNGGVPRSQLSTESLSYSKPMDPRQNRLAWARNRRVELVFNEVKNPEPLIEKLKPLMNQVPWDKRSN
jgi:outer membrane protein OmpA-like peptidoglycan-associated protein